MITGATYQGFSKQSDTQYVVLVRFTHDSGPATEENFPVSGTTQAEAVASLRRQIALKIGVKDVLGPILGQIALGTNIPLTAPAAAAPAAPTAKQVWQDKARSLSLVNQIGTPTGALATAVAALLADVNATYAAGYLTDL